MVPKQLPSGRVVVVDPQESCDAWSLGDPLAQAIVATVQADSPLTRHVRLDNVLFPGARLLKFTAEAEPLIRDPLDQPLLARLRRPSGDAVVLTCSLEKGDLPLRIAFPVLMKNTIEWFQGNSGELRPAVATGQMVSLDVSPAASSGAPAAASTPPAAPADGDGAVVVEAAAADATEEMTLVSPAQKLAPLTAADGKVTIGPLLETGLWTVRPAKQTSATNSAQATHATGDDPRVVRVACNLVDASESDLRPRGELADVEGRALVSLGGQSMWFYLTLLAAGLIATEWWLYQRRIVG
jgi:hypothetical protein